MPASFLDGSGIRKGHQVGICLPYAGASPLGTGENPKCLFTPCRQSLQVIFLLTSCLLPTSGVSFDRLKIKEDSKLGKEHMEAFLSSLTNG